MHLLSIPTLALLLWAALDRHSYGFYSFLRWEVCIAAGILAYLAYAKKQNTLMVCMILAGLIFNPIVPLHLGRGDLAREKWAIFNFAAAGIMLWAIIALWPKPEMPDEAAPKMRTEPSCGTVNPHTEQMTAAAQCLLGICYNEGNVAPKDYKEAAMWYRKAAEQGGATGQRLLGICYDEGNGVPQDYKEAVMWYRKSAAQGDAAAQSLLGICYANGTGAPQDYKEAVMWFSKSAEQGDATAQRNLGLCYTNGTGVPQDYKKAVMWFHKSAEQGNAAAQSSLGVFYANGMGVPQDYKEAVAWTRKSAEQGDALAQRNLAALLSKGPPESFF